MRRPLLAALAALLLAGGARAQDARPVQMIVVYPPGGATDLLARALAEAMGQSLGAPVAVLNRDGGAGSVGAAALAAARPDGLTIGFATATAVALQPVLNPSLPYRAASFAPLCATFDLTFALAVAPESPYRSLDDLVQAARARPGALAYGVNGTGSAAHLAMAEFVATGGLSMLHVPYRGDSLVVAPLRSGDIAAGTLAASLAASQDLRLLGLFARDRHPDFPEVPTLYEQGYDATQSAIGGLFAPAATPAPVLARLGAACAEAVRSAGYTAAARRLRERVCYEEAAAFARTIATDVEAKRRLLDGLGIRPG